MAKCYVIKNKDGEYSTWYPYIDWSSDIGCARFFDKKEYCIEEMKFHRVLDKDYKVVECTICEGDIEEELEVYKRAFDKLAHDLTTYEWEGLGRFARSEEIICAEALQEAREEIEMEKKDEN